VRLFERFQCWQVFPGAAATLWRELLERTERLPAKELTEDAVVTAFLKRTGLPEAFLRDELRLDMSEYSGPWAADRLLLKSDGECSDFLQQVRRQPFTVLLLDVFDEGRLTDRFGRITWFRSTVIVMTSNLGSESSAAVGFGEGARQSAARHERAVREFFRPEFFNRLDRVVTFEPLSIDVIERITEKELRQIAAREGLVRRGVRLSWTADVVRHLAQAGFDPRYGARPLQRTLESRIIAPLALKLVQNATTLPAEIHCLLRDGQVVLQER
jgi:ATP-dependent Clp protease ATP-binding subunit ClpC